MIGARLKIFFGIYDLDGGGSISRDELRRMFLQSPSYTGPENDLKAKKIWARQSLDAVFNTAKKASSYQYFSQVFNLSLGYVMLSLTLFLQANQGFIEDGDLTFAGFEYAANRKAKISHHHLAHNPDVRNLNEHLALTLTLTLTLI